jgi:excisionase family DNA binding protein
MSLYGQNAIPQLSENVPMDERLERQTLTVGEAAHRLGISRALAYKAAQRGELPVIRIGRRYLVLKTQLERILASTDPLTAAAEPTNPSTGESVP